MSTTYMVVQLLQAIQRHHLSSLYANNYTFLLTYLGTYSLNALCINLNIF